MRKTLYLKFILAYIIFGFFGFIVVGTFVSNMIMDHLTRDKSEDLYREATIIANTYANDLYNSQTSLDTVRIQISALSRYIKSTIWIINPSGRMVLDSSKIISPDSEVIVEGFDDLLIRFAHCCNPVPGDEIIGFITKGRGVSIHRADCINIQSLSEVDQGRIINVAWDDTKDGLEFEVDLRVLAEDRKGLLVDISKVTDEMGVSISALAAKADRESAVANINLTVALTDTKQLDRIIAKFKQIPGVADVYRAVV